MTNETEARQPAPSPAQIHVPAGTWALIVTNDEGKQITVNHGDTVQGPANLTISLAVPD